MSTERVTITLPAGMARSIDRARKGSGQSRSAFIRQAVDRMFAEIQNRRLTAEYRRGYIDLPESEQEVAAAEEAARYLLAEEPWD